MKNTKRTTLLSLLLVGMLALMLTACGGGGEEEKTLESLYAEGDNFTKSFVSGVESQGMTVELKDNLIKVHVDVPLNGHTVEEAAALMKDAASDEETLAPVRASLDTVQEQTGIEGVKLVYIYESDGETILEVPVKPNE